jgi:hypothetical protein
LCLAAGLTGSPTAAAAGLRGLLELNGHHVRWLPAEAGADTVVTYAFLDQPRSFPGARNCTAMLPLDELTQRSGLELAAVEQETAAAFAVWSAQAPLAFRRIDDPGQADILIGAQLGSRGIAFTNVADLSGPVGGTANLLQATICLDPAERWEIQGDGDPETYVVRRVLAHEIGHAIGLDHYGRRGGIMGFGYDDEPIGPADARLSPLDIAAVTFLYGGRAPVQPAADLPLRTADLPPVCGEPDAPRSAECALGMSRRPAEPLSRP